MIIVALLAIIGIIVGLAVFVGCVLACCCSFFSACLRSQEEGHITRSADRRQEIANNTATQRNAVSVQPSSYSQVSSNISSNLLTSTQTELEKIPS